MKDEAVGVICGMVDMVRWYLDALGKFINGFESEHPCSFSYSPAPVACPVQIAILKRALQKLRGRLSAYDRVRRGCKTRKRISLPQRRRGIWLRARATA